MRVELIDHRQRLASLAGEWNDLLARSRADSVFLTWEFVTAWLDVLRPQCELRVLAVRDEEGCLAGIAPFYLAPLKLVGALPYRCLRVLGDEGSAADYPDIIADTQREPEVLAALADALTDLSGWDCLWMARVATWRGAVDRIQALCDRAGFSIRTRGRPFSIIYLPASFDDYLNLLSKKTRYNLRRGRRQCEDLGPTRMITCANTGDIPLFLDELVRLHQSHWESAGDMGTFRRHPDLRLFFEEAARRMLSRGWLRLSGLEIRGQMHAAQYGFAYRGTYSAIQEGYDPGLAEVTCGVGNVARAAAIEGAIAEGLRVYDFLDGDTWHKQRWGAEVHEGHDLFVQRQSIRTLPLRAGRVWPTGRYLHWAPGRPAPAGAPA